MNFSRPFTICIKNLLVQYEKLGEACSLGTINLTKIVLEIKLAKSKLIFYSAWVECNF